MQLFLYLLNPQEKFNISFHIVEKWSRERRVWGEGKGYPFSVPIFRSFLSFLGHEC